MTKVSFQDPALFNDTIFQNVANGLSATVRARLSKTEIADLVHGACVDADVEQFAQSLPDGYQTKIGEGSNFLSGGQRQRIAIARAIVSNPPILLLDEATSALGPGAEQAVQKALDRVSRGRTTMIISHKLTTVQKADNIVFLKDGHVLEQGDHLSLLKSNGLYTNIFNSQTLRSSSMSTHSITNRVHSQQSSLESSEKMPTTSEIFVAASKLESPAPKTHDASLSLISCIAMIFREQRTIRTLFCFGCLACAVAGGAYPGQAVIFAKSVAVLSEQGQELVRGGTYWALLWFLLAIGVSLTFWIFRTIFLVTGSTITRHYRHDYFSSMMAQDMLFFAAPSNSSAALTANLLSHTQQLESLFSSTIGSIILVLVNVISSCALSIAITWKLGLVAIFGVFPLIGLAGFLQVRVNFQSVSRNADRYEEVMRFAAECITCIRTVSSLAMESEMCEIFEAKLRAPVSRAYRGAATIMLLFALSQSANLLGQNSKRKLAVIRTNLLP